VFRSEAALARRSGVRSVRCIEADARTCRNLQRSDTPPAAFNTMPALPGGDISNIWLSRLFRCHLFRERMDFCYGVQKKGRSV